MLGIVAVGYGSALFQGQYLGGAGPEAAIIAGNALTPLAVIAVCISAFRPGKFRSLAVIGIVVWTIVLFGRASRTLAALPVFILLGWLLSTRRRLRWWHVGITAIATIFLLQLPLALRANADGVGIFTLGEAFLSDPESVFAQFDPAGVFGNLLFSAPLTGLVGLREVPADALWVSLTPIGGSAAGWDSLAPALKVDGSTPYSTLGELAAHGTLELLAVPFFVGMVFALAERVASSLPGVMASAGQLVILAIIALYSVRILQYNLRTTTRLIWYMAAGLAAVWLLSLLFRHRAPRREKRVQYAAGESAPL
ncbi:MAG TPA: hypothetical protein EYQ31_07000 [Candidatus Handelsmanbacteria bacterium]|nr:hypothetical protein [Candidatus Handelsmanbacteria bacterium]